MEEVGPIDLTKADPRMLDIAEKTIDQQHGDFDPTLFVDGYEQALRESELGLAPPAVAGTPRS